MPSRRPTYDLVIAANRLPVDKVVSDTGEDEWRRSPGGLVTAMESVMRIMAVAGQMDFHTFAN